MQVPTPSKADTNCSSASACVTTTVTRRARWIRFLLVIFVLGTAIHYAPAVERLPFVGKQVTVLRESGVNVGAWYYDNVEEYFEAEEYIKYQKRKQARLKNDPAS
ncbi:hypothetical protein [Desulfohalobium retbaense]|uniref:Uncharacterized protein n=1 Tax=Desulfohalobium retbaense (strain ATCC 49708 / DSM 5692 / JCM 16813 / HR100) TaxID=485915 RepID=C8X1T5_DESRD|nr:hypothetical protein [Desulfohalobium retbaense]ACV68507.1 hypothetical protein Dret_1219 [Desulfohalobium retbaense DSM 5692]